MSEVAEQCKAYVTSLDAFEKDAKAGQKWLREIRENAISRFAELGFPNTRQEKWRFTDVSPIANTSFVPAERKPSGLTVADIAKYTFSEVECVRLVFLNGFYSPELSTLRNVPKGVRISSLSSALETDPLVMQSVLARHASLDDPFTALNTAFMSEGAFVHVQHRTELRQLVHIVYLSTGSKEPTVRYPRNVIVLGKGSQASVVETYGGLDKGAYFTDAVTEVVLEDGAQLDHYKLQGESEAAFHVATTQIFQQRDSSYSSHSISFGGSLVRNDLNVAMHSQGGECSLNGLYAVRGTQHIDNHTSIDHASPNCSSRELYKGILDDSATGVFDGKILVREGAQKTNSRQTNKNLLLSKTALVNSKPQLEIYADDVKCNHGATIGQLGEDELFYLRSRGIDRDSARTLLTYAFASDLLNAIKIKPIQCQLDLALLNRLSRPKSN